MLPLPRTAKEARTRTSAFLRLSMTTRRRNQWHKNTPPPIVEETSCPPNSARHQREQAEKYTIRSESTLRIPLLPSRPSNPMHENRRSICSTPKKRKTPCATYQYATTPAAVFLMYAAKNDAEKKKTSHTKIPPCNNTHVSSVGNTHTKTRRTRTTLNLMSRHFTLHSCADAEKLQPKLPPRSWTYDTKTSAVDSG